MGDGRSASLGRPTKYKPEYVEEAERLCCEEGYTDKQLAVHFKISERTLNNWKRGFLQFLQSIKKGKDEFDSEVVENALLKRALGYEYEEITQERCKDTGELLTTKVVKKQVPPEPVACFFWLKNRNPRRWRDINETVVRVFPTELTEDEIRERLEAQKNAGNGLVTG